MEITYDLIIQYLTIQNNKDNENIFTTQKNIYTYSTSWCDKFKDLLNNKFYRYGVSVYDTENNNISFWSSILTLLYNEFIIPYNEDEITIINNFKSQIIDKYNHKKLSKFIKKFDKNDFREKFKLIPDNDIIQYVIDILNINLIIFDFKDNNIKTVYPDESMNPWKQILLISKYDNLWEPIMSVNSKSEIQRLFDYNNIIIKKILYTPDLILYNSDNKIFSIINEINYVIENENNKINNVPISEKYDLKKLNKMKLSELLELSKQLNIIVSEKRPTKAVLINLILEK